MKNLKDYSVFEQEIQLRTKNFTGVPRYPAVADYLGLLTKNADSGPSPEISNFLKKKPKPDQAITNSTYLLKFIQEALENIKLAQPDLYGKLTGDSFVQKIKEVTSIR